VRRAVLAADNSNVGSYDPARLIDDSLVDDAAARGMGAAKSAQ